MKRLLLLLLSSCAAAVVPVPFGQASDGIITYYDGDGRGACGYDPTGDDFAAVTDGLWGGSAACGACFEIVGPKGTAVVRVVDRCPDCDANHFDLRRTTFAKVAEPADGRVSMKWRAVTCPTSGNLRLQLKDGSNPYWVAIQVRNHRRPVAKLEAKKAGSFKELQRTDYNYFVDESGIGEGPVEVRVTADDGTQVSATIQSVQPNTELAADGQF